MSFGLDTSGIPNIPGLATVASTPTAGISDKAKDLMTTLVDDRASLFANPMTNAITSTNATIDELRGLLTSISTGSSNTVSISANDASTFLLGTSLSDLQTSMGNLLSHTGRLSGVLTSSGIEAPGLEHIISIGKQMNDYVNLLNAGSGCLSMIGGCTGLFSQDDLAKQTSQIDDVIDKITRNVATIADVGEAVNNLRSFVEGIISKDSQFLQNCVTQLKQAALAMALEYAFKDPCAKFVMEQVSNRNPGGLLNKIVG